MKYSFHFLLALLFLVSCGEEKAKKIEIIEDPNFWEEVVPTLNVEPGLTYAMTDKQWRGLLSSPYIPGQRAINFHVLDSGTFFLERMTRPLTFFYSDDFGKTWNGVSIKDEEDPSFVPYFKEGGVSATTSKIRVSTGTGGTLFRSKGKGGTFESTDGKNWKKITLKEPFNLSPRGLEYAENYVGSFTNSSTMRKVYDFQKKQIYEEVLPKSEEGNYPYLVITCDGSEIEYYGLPILSRFPTKYDEQNFELTDEFMLQESALVYDDIFGVNYGPVDQYISNLNNGEGISGKKRLIEEGDYAYYIRLNGQWIKTNQHLRASSVRYSPKDKRMYGISDDGKLYKSKSTVKITCS